MKTTKKTTRKNKKETIKMKNTTTTKVNINV